jgi:hypothetical protein
MIYTKNFLIDKNYKPDIFYRRLYDFFNLQHCKIFLETGTFNGNGVDWAVYNNHYDEIYSIEIDKLKYDYCINKFKNNNKVQIINDSSENHLKKIVPKLNKSTFVYLDAHFDGNYPIINESKIILNNFYDLNNIIVCIDDERLFSKNLKIEVTNLYKLYGFIDCYLDDSMVFYKNNFFLKI